MSLSAQTAQVDRVAPLTLPVKRQHGTSNRPLRVATFLAPNLFAVYRFIVRRIASELGCAMELFTGTSYQQLATEVDAAFLCGLAYVEFSRQKSFPLEPLVAPVLHGNRYGDKPV